MIITDVLITCLKDWDKLTAEGQINDYKNLIDFILLHLGIISDASSKSKLELSVELKNRIEYLTEEEGIDEDLLVMGLVNFITESLEATLMKQGQTIILDEKLLASTRVDFDMKNRLLYSLDKLRKNSFYEKATKELDQWQSIVAGTFTKGNRASWKKENFEVAAEDLEDDFSQLNQKVLNIIFDIPIIQLISNVDLEDIKNLSYSEALALREKLI